MATTSRDSHTSPRSSPSTLWGLPSELRLLIFEEVFKSTTLFIGRGPQVTDQIEVDNLEVIGDVEVTFLQPTRHGMSVTPPLPEKLSLVCRKFRDEIEDMGSGHSQVTYHFASTVAFIDVLSQWPREKVATIRHAYVCAYPLPLYPYDDDMVYRTHFMPECLAMFPELQLDVLTVENIWLFSNGEPLDAWCAGATAYEISDLLATHGWKEFRYMSGVLPLSPSGIRDLDEAVATLRKERKEPNFQYNVLHWRPLPPGRGASSTDDMLAESELDHYYKQHPEEHPARKALPENTKKEVMVWAKRGIAERDEGVKLHPEIQSLMDNLTWLELRNSEKYLVNDGMDDPAAHL